MIGEAIVLTVLLMLPHRALAEEKRLLAPLVNKDVLSWRSFDTALPLLLLFPRLVPGEAEEVGEVEEVYDDGSAWLALSKWVWVKLC